MNENLKLLSTLKTQHNLSLKSKLNYARALYSELLARNLEETSAFDLASALFGNPDRLASKADCYDFLVANGVMLKSYRTFLRSIEPVIGQEIVISYEGNIQRSSDYRICRMNNAAYIISLESLPFIFVNKI